MQSVRVSVEKMIIPTYETAPYEELPLFAFNRGHQGTTGNPYPHRVVSRVRRDSKIDKTYTAVHLENEYLDIIILPEIGGKIFAAQDKTNGYDFFYRHHTIKPALIGVYGLWISGGLEFNWARHHRPSTFMPSDYAIERGGDGSVTVWLSEHDPLFRMKGMVGVALYPGKSLVETRMKIFNRTEMPHTFHWWENAAVSANEKYQVFFPPDVTYVSHHYRRATGAYPIMDSYYMIQDNRGGVDIRFHGNTQTANSYFSGVSKYDFFGGYDHTKDAGVIHYASHHTSPGKKMFTWGYGDRAKAWENALTDSDGPYLELMASSYGDNQPDFAWIEPWELKEFNQIWYPYKTIGEPQIAGADAAVRYERSGDNLAVNVYANENLPRAVLEIGGSGQASKKILYLQAAVPQKIVFDSLGSMVRDGFTVTLKRETGEVLLAYTQKTPEPYVPEPLKEVPGPDTFSKVDDCFAAGLHIDQYYDPLIKPDVYWEKGLSLDPDHIGCLTNLGRLYLLRQDYAEAEKVLRRAVKNITKYNPNPRDSEMFYLLGLTLIKQKKNEEAVEILHKALWSADQTFPASCAIAAVYSSSGLYADAEKLLCRAVKKSGENRRALGMLITVLRKQGKRYAALDLARNCAAEDMLDFHILNELRLLGEAAPMEERFLYRMDETGLDLAGDYAAMGLWEDALELINRIGERQEPTYMMLYMGGFMQAMMGNIEAAQAWYAKAEKAPLSMRFPSLPFEAEALENAAALMPGSAGARTYLAMLQYGQRLKTDEAAALLEEAHRLDPSSIQASRNLAVGLFSKNNDDPRVLALLDECHKLKPEELQLIYERNIAASLQNEPLEKRQAFFDALKISPASWDEIYLQKIKLLNLLGQHEKALKMLVEHTFIPAEGAEHAIIEEYGSTLEIMGLKALKEDKVEEALMHFSTAIDKPLALGSYPHEIFYVPCKYGKALCYFRMKKGNEAKEILSQISDLYVDNAPLFNLPFYLYFRGMAFLGLGKNEEGKKCLETLKQNAETGLAQNQYGLFSATSAYLSFLRDPAAERKIQCGLLLVLALNGLGEKQKALEELDKVLKLSPSGEEAALTKARIS